MHRKFRHSTYCSSAKVWLPRCTHKISLDKRTESHRFFHRTHKKEKGNRVFNANISTWNTKIETQIHNSKTTHNKNQFIDYCVFDVSNWWLVLYYIEVIWMPSDGSQFNAYDFWHFSLHIQWFAPFSNWQHLNAIPRVTTGKQPIEMLIDDQFIWISHLSFSLSLFLPDLNVKYAHDAITGSMIETRFSKG